MIRGPVHDVCKRPGEGDGGNRLYAAKSIEVEVERFMPLGVLDSPRDARKAAGDAEDRRDFEATRAFADKWICYLSDLQLCVEVVHLFLHSQAHLKAQR
jgi:hypothetical protein